MRRRDMLVAMLLSAGGARTVLGAAKSNHIAIVAVSAAPAVMTEGSSEYGVLFEEMRRLGYQEGRNLVVDRFSAGGSPSRIDDVVRQAVAARPNVIVATGTPLTLSLKAATQTIPIVCLVTDALANGVFTNLARPGGNITGVTSSVDMDMWGKRLEILHEAVPAMSRVGFLAGTAKIRTQEEALKKAAERLSISVISLWLSGTIDESEYRRVFEALPGEHVQGLIVNDSAQYFPHMRLIVELANKAGVPTIYPFSNYLQLGGLLAYGIDSNDGYRRAAACIDQILRGTDPGEIPVFQPTKFSLAINQHTARALGLSLPPTLLARADEVIE